MASAYSWLILNIRLVVRDQRLHWLWKLKCLEKIKLLLWLCYHHALPVGMLRFWRGFSSSSTCTMCNASIETIEHCLWDCP